MVLSVDSAAVPSTRAAQNQRRLFPRLYAGSFLEIACLAERSHSALDALGGQDHRVQRCKVYFSLPSSKHQPKV
jgi:hypothetical protein